MTRFLFFHLRAGLSLGALIALAPAAGVPVLAQAPETYNACFVPTVGAIYLIKRTGLPSGCVASGHVEITWTSGAVLADGSVTAMKVADGAIITIKLADGAVTAAKLAAGAVGTVQIADGAVTSAKLGSDVGAAILGNGSVTTAKLADGAATTVKVADGAVTEAKLAFDPATQAELAALQSVGTINGVSNPVDWTQLKGVPAGLADGVDDAGTGTVTSITAGAGLTGGTITTSGTIAVDFSGPGSAATVARSDHTHAKPGSNNTSVGSSALSNNSAGGFNTAVGATALNNNATGGDNTAVGSAALAANQTGGDNTAVGSGALIFNTASNNTALGAGALNGNTSGSDNTAVGRQALVRNQTGQRNTAVGEYALWWLTGGSGNTALGYNAGLQVEGSNNVHIANSGEQTDNATIRIGTQGTQTKTFIAGIRGITTDAADAVAVLVSSTGQLGTVSSSRRFKDDIRDMGDASRRLLDLRPVVFRYKRPASDGSRPLEYGLIAEEVAEVFPELVVYDSTGQAETVRYHILPALLLNELQRQERELQALRLAVDSLRTALAGRSQATPAVEARR